MGILENNNLIGVTVVIRFTNSINILLQMCQFWFQILNDL